MSGGRSDLDLQRFDPQQHVRLPNAMAFIGKRCTGKTTMLRDIYSHVRKDVQDTVVFSATEDINPVWSTEEHIPSASIHNKFDSAKLEAIVNRQRDRIQTWIVGDQKDPYPHLMIIFEDMAYSKEFNHDKTVHNLFMNGKLFGITVAFTIQYLLDLPRGFRNMIDQAFVMYNNSEANVQRIYWTFGIGTTYVDGCDLSQFKETIEEHTKNYGAIVVDTNEDRRILRRYRVE